MSDEQFSILLQMMNYQSEQLNVLIMLTSGKKLEAQKHSESATEVYEAFVKRYAGYLKTNNNK